LKLKVSDTVVEGVVRLERVFRMGGSVGLTDTPADNR